MGLCGAGRGGTAQPPTLPPSAHGRAQSRASHPLARPGRPKRCSCGRHRCPAQRPKMEPGPDLAWARDVARRPPGLRSQRWEVPRGGRAAGEKGRRGRRPGTAHLDPPPRPGPASADRRLRVSPGNPQPPASLLPFGPTSPVLLPGPPHGLSLLCRLFGLAPTVIPFHRPAQRNPKTLIFPALPSPSVLWAWAWQPPKPRNPPGPDPAPKSTSSQPRPLGPCSRPAPHPAPGSTAPPGTPSHTALLPGPRNPSPALHKSLASTRRPDPTALGPTLGAA